MEIKEKVLKEIEKKLIPTTLEEIRIQELEIIDLTLAEVGKVINEGCNYVGSKFHKCGKMFWLCDRCRKLKQKLGIK